MKNSDQAISAYGIKDQTRTGDEFDLAAESLGLLGYALVDSGYSASEREQLARAFDEVVDCNAALHGGLTALRQIDEHNTVRAPLALNEHFLELALNPRILSLCRRLLGEVFILNQQNAISNPPAQPYNQGAYHRDLPYQHFVSSKPLAINALYCVDEFRIENGATKVIPGSHRQASFPSDLAVLAAEVTVCAPAGTFIVLDCMAFHSGGHNGTNTPRRAVNQVYSLAFIKQQIVLETLFKGRSLPAVTGKLLDFGAHATDVETYYQQRRSKLAR